MDASEDYYVILGISREANGDQIKKAYRKLALRWHPDKNLDNRELAEKNFKRLAEAYEVLSDQGKRQIYDRYGKEGLVNAGPDSAGPGPGFGFGFPGMANLFGGPFVGGVGPGMFFSFRDPNDVFREFFGGNDPFADFFNGNNFNCQQQQEAYDNQHNNHQSSSMSFMDPFGMGSMFGGMGGFGGMSSMSMQMTGGGPEGANVKRISTSVKVVNGKRVETKRVVDNGVETVTITENGQVKSRTVNGQPQLTN